MTTKKPKQPFHAFRRAAGLTIEQAAKEFGVERTAIIRWERGEPHIPVWRLPDAERILKANRAALRPDIFAGAA